MCVWLFLQHKTTPRAYIEFGWESKALGTVLINLYLMPYKALFGTGTCI
jgi:hypothetical protein